MREFTVKKGDEVTLILTNLTRSRTWTHGFASRPSTTSSSLSTRWRPSRSPSWPTSLARVLGLLLHAFCHALHLEMRTRTIVEAR